MDDRSVQREAFVLGRLGAAEGRVVGRGRLKPVKAVERELGLDAGVLDDVLRGLAEAGHVEERRRGKAASYRLTDAGAAHLRTLPADVAPTRPPKAVRPPPPVLEEDPELVPFQEAFLLLQLLGAAGRTLAEGAANRLPGVAKQELELSKALADQLRRKLAERGYVARDKVGRSVHLTLTPAGAEYLASLRHHPAATFAVSGAALNELLDAARGGSAPATTAKATTTGEPAPPADLARAAHDAFGELLRERYARERLVPIFAVRRQVAREHGDEAARHDVLDEAILSLWRAGRVRLISLSDLRRARPDELADSIPNNYETLFYMEDADGHGTR